MRSESTPYANPLTQLQIVKKLSVKFADDPLKIEHRTPSGVAPPLEIETEHVQPWKTDKTQSCTLAPEESPPNTVTSKYSELAHTTQ